jgi:polysaccharide export outer membrane protein
MLQYLAGVVLCCAMISLSPAQAEVSTPAAGSPPVPAAGPAADQAEAVDDYYIGPYDLLEITVFQVADLSRTVRVNARGLIGLPLIGQVQAAGLSARVVEEEIARRLSECCLQDPQVTIFIKEFVSQRVTVEGEVMKPGIFALSGRTSLLQAIALASGASQIADINEVSIFRTLPGGNKEQLMFDLEAIRSGKVDDPQIQGNDVVVIGSSTGRSMVKGVTETLRGFIGFGTIR